MTVLHEFAGYLPGIRTEDIQWEKLRFEGGGQTLDVSVPVLSEVQVKDLSNRVKTASRRYLKSLSVAQIVSTIDAVIARLLDVHDPCRQKADRLLPLVSGFDADMVRLGLTQYLKTFRKPQLQRFLVEDFTNPLLLDDFQPRVKGGFSKAFGADLAVHVWAGNVPGLPLWSLISGLLVKSGTIGKVSSAEPLVAGWFAQMLVEVDPRLADCLAVVWWRGGDALQEQLFYSQADLVLAYGGNPALEAIRKQVPLTSRFLPFGHKISFALVSKAALDVRQGLKSAQLAALDIVRYEQQGCYSPHVIYVQRAGAISPEDFARYLSNELQALEKKYPPSKLSLNDAVLMANWTQAQEIKALSEPRSDVSSGRHGTVVFCDQLQPFEPTAMNRTIKVVAVDDLTQVLPLIEPHRAYLQTVGLAATPEEIFKLAHQLGTLGVTRICALGEMTAPEAGWHHDGRFSLLDLISMVDVESSSHMLAERHAPYAD